MGTTEGESLLSIWMSLQAMDLCSICLNWTLLQFQRCTLRKAIRTGRGYFDLLGDYGTYSISKNEQGTIITLKGDPEVKEDDLVDDSDPAIQDLKTKTDAYEYYYDTKGNLMKVKGKVRRNLYNKDFVIERMM